MKSKIFTLFIAICFSAVASYAIDLPEKLAKELEAFSQVEDVTNGEAVLDDTVTSKDLFAFILQHKGENLIGTPYLNVIQTALWYTETGKAWFKSQTVADQRAIAETLNWVPRIIEDYATQDEVKTLGSSAFYYFPHVIIAQARLKLSESEYQAMLDEVQTAYIGSGYIFENSRDWFKNLLKKLEQAGEIKQAYAYVSAEDAAFAPRLADNMDNAEMRKWAGYLSYIKGRLKKDLN